MRSIVPDFMFASFLDISPAFLKENGIKALFIDIDNTLAPYEVADADEATVGWFSGIREAGIAACLISNNTKERAERFNKSLHLPVYPDSRKPGTKSYLAAMKKLGVTANESAVLGDQLLTDAAAGARLGMKKLIVPPIKDKANLFFRFKRRVERPLIARYARKNGYAAFLSFWKIKEK